MPTTSQAIAQLSANPFDHRSGLRYCQRAATSSGGVHVSQILKLLEPYPIEEMGHNSAAYLHLLIESMKLAYADRSEYLGDPDRTEIPVKALTSDAYLDGRRTLIQDDVATPSEVIKPGSVDDNESTETTHFSIVDQFGNVVTNTYTINFSFGSGIVVLRTGMLLNNEMDDFAAKLASPTAMALYKVKQTQLPREPAALVNDPNLSIQRGKAGLPQEAPGSRIITAVAQTLLNLMAFDMTLGMATSSPESITSGCLIWRWSSPAYLPTRSISSRRASTKSCAQTAQSAA